MAYKPLCAVKPFFSGDEEKDDRNPEDLFEIVIGDIRRIAQDAFKRQTAQHHVPLEDHPIINRLLDSNWRSLGFTSGGGEFINKNNDEGNPLPPEEK